MAAISITAANVKQGGNAILTEGVAGATITAGQTVLRGADGKFVLSDADGNNLKSVVGIALNGAADGQPLKVQTGGDIAIGATLTAGTTYYLSPTPGGIGPLGDVEAGDDVIIIGIAKSTSVLMLRITDPDVTI
jgi:hypothetical protein